MDADTALPLAVGAVPRRACVRSLAGGECERRRWATQVLLLLLLLREGERRAHLQCIHTRATFAHEKDWRR